jgi:hypothetical protein
MCQRMELDQLDLQVEQVERVLMQSIVTVPAPISGNALTWIRLIS